MIDLAARAILLLVRPSVTVLHRLGFRVVHVEQLGRASRDLHTQRWHFRPGPAPDPPPPGPPGLPESPVYRILEEL